MSGMGAIDFLIVAHWVELLLQSSHGSKLLKKRKHCTPEQFEKRRDVGVSRGHKDGSLPHFLKEQSDQKAGAKLEKPTEFDAQVKEAMHNCPDVSLNTVQKKLEKTARNRVRNVSERHEEMIKPESEKLQKKLKMYIKEDQKTEETHWCQQMSFSSQLKNDRFLNLAETRWMAPGKEDKAIIREFSQSVWSDVVEFLHPQKGHTVWCVEDTDVFINGFSSDTFQKALRKEPVLFAAVLFGGYVVDHTWLKKAAELFQINEQVVEPHWRLKGAVRMPLELVVHDSFKEQEEFVQFSKIIRQAQSTRWVVGQKGMAHGSLLSHWIVRDSRKELRQAKRGLGGPKMVIFQMVCSGQLISVYPHGFKP